jgi:hypothetical protein
MRISFPLFDLRNSIPTARKLQLMERLWAPDCLSSRELLTKASELILRLYGDKPSDSMEELVFFGGDLSRAMPVATPRK